MAASHIFPLLIRPALRVCASKAGAYYPPQVLRRAYNTSRVGKATAVQETHRKDVFDFDLEGLSRDSPSNLQVTSKTDVPKQQRVALLPNQVSKSVQSVLERNELLHISIDGQVKKFEPIFLRDCCQCSVCTDPHSGQKRFETAEIPADIKIARADQDKDGSIRLCWEKDVPGIPQDHATAFTPDFFLNRVSFATRNPLPEVRAWKAREMDTAFTKIDYESFLHNLEAYEAALQKLQSHGLVVIAGVPESEQSVEHIAEMIGPVRDSFYGRTWDVIDKPQATNVAYTSVHLGLHMDLLYMKNPPGLQLLHCLTPSKQGGESIFADALHAASIIERTSPSHFEDLCTFPVTYHYHKAGHHFTDSKPVFEISSAHDQHSATTRVPFILNTNWSPPFQGPLQLDIGLEDNGRRLRNWHQAAQAFAEIVNHDSALFRYQMAAGDCVIFNNRRVLHGRTAFKPGDVAQGSKPRWLKGAYLDMDDFDSKMRGIRERSRTRSGDAVSPKA